MIILITIIIVVLVVINIIIIIIIIIISTPKVALEFLTASLVYRIFWLNFLRFSTLNKVIPSFSQAIWKTSQLYLKTYVGGFSAVQYYSTIRRYILWNELFDKL